MLIKYTEYTENRATENEREREKTGAATKKRELNRKRPTRK